MIYTACSQSTACFYVRVALLFLLKVSCICSNSDKIQSKSKAIPLQAWTGPEGYRRLRLPRFQDNRHMKLIRLSALRTGRLYPPKKYSWYSFLLESGSTPRGHSAAGRIMSMKNSNYTIVNRTRDLPASSSDNILCVEFEYSLYFLLVTCLVEYTK
jgi:hypothetical protein